MGTSSPERRRRRRRWRRRWSRRRSLRDELEERRRSRELEESRRRRRLLVEKLLEDEVLLVLSLRTPKGLASLRDLVKGVLRVFTKRSLLVSFDKPGLTRPSTPHKHFVNKELAVPPTCNIRRQHYNPVAPTNSRAKTRVNTPQSGRRTGDPCPKTC